MKATKRFLNSYEIYFVVSEALKAKNDYITQEFLIQGIIGQLIFTEDERIAKANSVNEVYDILQEDGIELKDYVNNYNTVVNLVNKYNSFDTQLNIFLEKIEKSIEELNIKDSLKELTEVKTKKTRKKVTEA